VESPPCAPYTGETALPGAAAGRKAAIAAFYRELYEGKTGTEEYKIQTVKRLGTILQQFRRDNKSFPGPVRDPWEFFSFYAELDWFPRHKQMLEGESDNRLIGKIDMEFRRFLTAEQYKVRPVEKVKRTTKAELAADLKETKTSDFGQWLQRLYERRDKAGQLYTMLIHETLTENAKSTRAELKLDKALLIRDLAKNPNRRIRSLTYKKSRSK
jgi:hypothetical protein